MEGDNQNSTVSESEVISIHSLRMEGDFIQRATQLVYKNFNPLPPHGGRHARKCSLRFNIEFQSTPSAWRETVKTSTNAVLDFTFQSTPSAWRETTCIPQHSQIFPISIHSLRMEGDHKVPLNLHRLIYFNPLPPHGGRPKQVWTPSDVHNISIHSLRMEGDGMGKIYF